MWRELYMGHFIERHQRTYQHKSREIWYNSRVSCKRDSLFDIVPGSGKSVRPDFRGLKYRPEALTGRLDPWPPRLGATGKTPVGRDDLIAPPLVGAAFHRRPPTVVLRVPRDRLSGELRKRIRRPQHVRDSVLVLPRKPLLSRTRQEYGVASYGNHAAQPLFLCFVQARSGASRKQGFEGAPLFFSAQGGGTQ